MKSKKSQLLPRQFFFGIVFFTIAISLTVALIVAVDTGIPGENQAESAMKLKMDESEIVAFNNTYNVQENITSNANKLQERIEDLRVENPLEIITLPVAFVQTGWEVVVFIFKSFGFMNDAIYGLSTYLHIPVFVPALIIVLIVLFFVFAVISLIFNKDF